MDYPKIWPNSRSFFSVAEMGTEKGSRIVTAAIKDIQVEKIHGPGDAASVNISSFWEHQVPGSKPALH
jgi:hypothetical protein